MLPVVRSQDGRIPGGIIQFFKRRARRILPPYYAALILSLVFDELLRRSSAIGLSKATPQLVDANFNAVNIVSHLFLVQNWFPRWIYGINLTHWSVAAEWQIYFLFPFLLLPVWRRWGNREAVCAGLILGVFPFFACPSLAYWACPQYVVLFVMGMAGAAVSFSSKSHLMRLRRSVPWSAAALLPFISFILIARFLSDGLESNGELDVPEAWTIDLLMGLAAISMIIFCTKAVTERDMARPLLMVRVLESPIATGLGVFSYSIYLIHVPVVWRIKNVLNRIDHYNDVNFILMLAIGVPLTLLLCYLFHLAFERRFMTNLSIPKKMNNEVFLSATKAE